MATASMRPQLQPGQLQPGQRIRAADADRERVAEQLSAHHAAGRLDLDEFNGRVDLAYAATYLDQLDPLLADLPGPAPASTGRDDWAARWQRVPRLAGLPVPLLALAVLAVVLSVGAVSNGMPPFPLFWFVVVMLWWGRWGRRPTPERSMISSPGR